jgi:hypothetical protein
LEIVKTASFRSESCSSPSQHLLSSGNYIFRRYLKPRNRVGGLQGQGHTHTQLRSQKLVSRCYRPFLLPLLCFFQIGDSSTSFAFGMDGKELNSAQVHLLSVNASNIYTSNTPLGLGVRRRPVVLYGPLLWLHGMESRALDWFSEGVTLRSVAAQHLCLKAAQRAACSALPIYMVHVQDN